MNEIIKKNGITFGVISGIISILITTLIYIIDVNLFASWWLGLLSLAISITLASVLMSKTKKALNGIFTFKDAFTTYFIYAVIGIAFGVIFNIILFNYIDPSLKENLKEILIKKTVSVMQKIGGENPEAVKEVIKKMSENDPYSVLEQLKGYFFALLFSSIFGLILAAFFKSKPAYNE